MITKLSAALKAALRRHAEILAVTAGGVLVTIAALMVAVPLGVGLAGVLLIVAGLDIL